MSTDLVREVSPVSLTTQSHYVIKRRFWSFFERVFRVFTGDGQLIMYIQHPLLKLREEFMVYADEAKTRPLLQRQVAAGRSRSTSRTTSPTCTTGELLGAVQKKGLRSIVRDKFIILDPTGAEIGYAEEQGASLLRPLLPVPDVEARDLRRRAAGRVHRAAVPVLHQGVRRRPPAVAARSAVRARRRAARADGRGAPRRQPLSGQRRPDSSSVPACVR